MTEFSPIETLNREQYNKALLHYQSALCEYCYGNIFAWSSYYQTEYAVFFDSVYVFQYHIENKAYFSFPIGLQNDGQFKEIIQELFLWCNGKNQSVQLIFLSFLEMEKLKEFFPGQFEGEECRDNFDYYYDTVNLKTFSGKKLHSKKNHMNKFFSLYGTSYRYEKITDQNIDQCIALNKKWCEINKKYEDIDLKIEEKIAATFLNHFTELSLIGGLLSVNGTPCAYTVGEEAYPNADTLIIHIEKALYDIQGAYPAVFSMFLNDNPQFLSVNREDDMGDEGLRASKLSYQPKKLLEKYVCRSK